MYSVSEWVKIQYLLWILNTNYCVPDENYSRKHIFRVWFVSFEEAKKKTEYTTNAVSTNVIQFVLYTTGSMPIASPKQLSSYILHFQPKFKLSLKKIKQFSWVTFQISKNTDAVLIFFLTPDIDNEFIY